MKIKFKAMNIKKSQKDGEIFLDVISPKNRLKGAYIYNSRGISPRNIIDNAVIITEVNHER
jgi:hypothetical protein